MLIRFQTIFPDSTVPGRVLFSSDPSWQNNSPSALFSQRRENFFKHTNLQFPRGRGILCKTILSCGALSRHLMRRRSSLAHLPSHTHHAPPTQKFPSTSQMPSWGMTLNHQADSGTRMTKSPKGKLRVRTPCWDCRGSGEHFCQLSLTVLSEQQFPPVC